MRYEFSGYELDDECFELRRGEEIVAVLALHHLAFLSKGINPLFIGAPGTGKTFLARALAYQACQERALNRYVIPSAALTGEARLRPRRRPWRRTASAPASGSLGTGDPADSGTP